MNEAEIIAPVRNLVVVLNPTAGRGRGGRLRSELETLLKNGAANLPEPFDWRIVETQRQGDGTRLAQEAVAGGADCVAAAGGDGTLSEVLNGVLGSSARLGLIPLGTGNDFARTLGLGADRAFAIETLLHGVAKSVDVGKTQGRPFLNVAGCGFDAVVAARINRGLRFLHGTLAYLAAVLRELPAFRAAHLRITLDDATWETSAMLCSVANAKSYGGGMLIAPDAQIDDGLFDLCVVQEVGRMEFLRVFPRVFKGEHVSHPKVVMRRARTIHIESDPSLPVLVDGEVVGTTPATFTLTPNAIQIMSPRITL